MTVSVQTNRDEFTGNGVTTAFATTFEFQTGTDLKVYLDGVLKTITTHYTVSGGAGSTGTVAFLIAPGNGLEVVIYDDPPVTQGTDYTPNDAFPAESHELALDKLTRIARTLKSRVDRAAVLSDFDTSGADTTLPTPSSRRAIVWNTAADGFENSTYDPDNVVLEAASSASAAATSETNAATSAANAATSESSASTSASNASTSATQAASSATLAQSVFEGAINDFRLTLTSNTAVTASDVTGATTIYCTPYKGSRISLYNGSSWNVRTSAEFSLALGTLTSGRPYDVFCYDNSGTPTLEFLAWTNDTARATGLAYQNGVLVKSGAATRRYLGTFYTTSTTETEDSAAKRFLWNYYHRIPRQMRVTDATATWAYTTATLRQANGNAANQLDMVIGVVEDVVTAETMAMADNSTGGATALMLTQIGLDSTTAGSSETRSASTTGAAGAPVQMRATFNGYVGIGRHYLSWLEFSSAVGTTTWRGASARGIYGVVMA